MCYLYSVNWLRITFNYKCFIESGSSRTDQNSNHFVNVCVNPAFANFNSPSDSSFFNNLRDSRFLIHARKYTFHSFSIQ